MNWTRFLGVLACVVLGTGKAWAQCATPVFAETFVDPLFVDCNGTGGTTTVPFGWASGGLGGGGNWDLDGDGRVGAAESADGDAVFGSIADALSCTTAGGTVHVTVPGVYREAVTITRSVTVRGADGGGVILDGGSATCTTPGASLDGITVTVGASTDVVRLENLTIRRFTSTNQSGVRIAGTANPKLIELLRCHLDENFWGMSFGGTSTAFTVSLVDSEVSASISDGLHVTGGGTLLTTSVERTRIMHCGGDGIFAAAETPFGPFLITSSKIDGNVGSGVSVTGNSFGSGGALVKVHDSTFDENGSDGLHLSGGANVAQLTASNSEFSSNGDDGIEFAAVSTTGVNGITLTDCRLASNVGNGLHVTSSGATTKTTIMGNSFVMNGAKGTNLPGAPAAIQCNPGLNLWALNVGGNRGGISLTNCAVGGGGVNTEQN